jgi:uncharacterized membrane protein YfcA
MTDVLLLLVTGSVAGALAGLLGIGGGVIIVPVLVFVFRYHGVDTAVLMHVAIGTSLATIAVTSLSSIRAHQAHGAIRWEVFRYIAPGVVVGGLCGAAVADALPSETLRLLFAPFMVVIAIQLAMGRASKPHRQLPGPVGLVNAGGVIGTVSALFGIGGGSMSVPFLTWCNVPVRNAVATAAAIGLPIAVAGGLGFVYAGWNVPGRPEWSIGFINLPATLGIVAASTFSAPFGAKLAHRIPEQLLRRSFAALLIVLAIKMAMG